MKVRKRKLYSDVCRYRFAKLYMGSPWFIESRYERNRRRPSPRPRATVRGWQNQPNPTSRYTRPAPGKFSVVKFESTCDVFYDGFRVDADFIIKPRPASKHQRLLFNTPSEHRDAIARGRYFRVIHEVASELTAHPFPDSAVRMEDRLAYVKAFIRMMF